MDKSTMDTTSSLIEIEKSVMNPFVFTDSVVGDDFSNREAVIHKISKVTFRSKAQGNVWVVGGRQIGKTSLLQQIEKLYQDEPPVIKLYGTNRNFTVIFLYCNCQSIRDEIGFYQSLTQCLTNHFNLTIPKKDPKGYGNFIHCLKEIYEKKCYIIFLLDEFDAFIEKLKHKSPDDAGHFLDELNVWKQRTPGVKEHQKTVGLICTANCSIGELTTDLTLTGSGLTFFEEIELSNFSETQLVDLATQYLEGNPIQFTKPELHFCYEMTHGYPLFVQNLLSIMYEEKQNAPSKDFLKSVESEYGKSFKKIVKGWERQNKLSYRTYLKIKEMGPTFKDELKDFIATLIVKGVENS